MVQRNFIERGGLNCAGIVPAGNFGRCDHHACGSRQRRSMQRLANMANRVLSGAVLVQEAATRGEIEQREADEQSAIAAQCVPTRVAKLVAMRTFHVCNQATSTLPRLDSLNQGSVAFSATLAAPRS